MFKSLGKAFLDVFRKPIGLIYGIILTFLFIVLFSIIYEYTYDFLPMGTVSFITTLLYLIKSHFWVLLIYFGFYLIFAYFLSLLITYVINKKARTEKLTQGHTKVFGFTIFFSIISLIPNILFGFSNAPSLTLSLLFLLISLFYVFFVYPVLLCAPILLVKYDLKYSLSEAYKFAKQHYGWIIVLQILFVLVLMILSYVLDLLSIYFLGVISFASFILIFVILFFWGINFIDNWYNDTVILDKKK